MEPLDSQGSREQEAPRYEIVGLLRIVRVIRVVERKTVNNVLSVLGKLLKVAVKWKVITAIPWHHKVSSPNCTDGGSPLVPTADGGTTCAGQPSRSSSAHSAPAAGSR